MLQLQLIESMVLSMVYMYITCT